MQTKHLCVLIHIWTNISPPVKYFLLTVRRRYFFCGSFVFLCLVFLMLLRLFIVALWSPAGKGLTSLLLLVMFIFFYFPMWYPGPGVVLDCIVSWSLPPFLLLIFFSFNEQETVPILVSQQTHIKFIANLWETIYSYSQIHVI